MTSAEVNPVDKFIAIATLRDRGAADAAADALTESEIPVEVRVLGTNPYFGTVTGVEIEVRVPGARIVEAEAVLARLAEESSEALRSEQPWRDDEQAAADALREAPPPKREPSRALAFVYSLFIPVLGPLYVGSPQLALASLLVHVPLLVLLWRGHLYAPSLSLFWLLGRVVDIIGTQQALMRRRALAGMPADAAPADGGDHAAQS